MKITDQMVNVLGALSCGQRRFTALMADTIGKTGTGQTMAAKALRACQDQGYVVRISRGVYELTPSGRKLLEALANKKEEKEEKKN